MAEEQNDRVWDHLQALAAGQAPEGQEMIFDPVSGRLLIVDGDTRRPADAVIADQTAQQGFNWHLAGRGEGSDEAVRVCVA
jgi:hypothetical protein